MINVEELRATIKSLEKRNEIEINGIISRAVLSNAKYKVGDIVKDSCRSIEITKVKWSKNPHFSNEFKPQAAYFGYVLTKTLARRKDQDTTVIYENDIDADF